MTKQACGIACLVAAIGSWNAARAEDDAPSARGCEVDVARAPDDVRAAIARWVAEEPRCGAPLAVRVVATADGLYVLAQSADGRTFERIVPDAEAAGVLVASWAARADEGAPASAPPATAAAGPAVGGTIAGEPVDGGAAPAARVAGSRRWIEVAGVVEERDVIGAAARGQLEVARAGGLSAGLGVELRAASAATVTATAMPDRVALVEATVGLLGAWTAPIAAWHLRAELELGFGGYHVYRWSANNRVRASLEVGRHLGGRWGVFARGESMTRRDGLGTVLHDATNFSVDSHDLGVAIGLATPL